MTVLRVLCFASTSALLQLACIGPEKAMPSDDGDAGSSEYWPDVTESGPVPGEGVDCGPTAPCPATAPCCKPKGSSPEWVNGNGTCVVAADGDVCLCTTAGDCSAFNSPSRAACVPVRVAGAFVYGTWTCGPNDGTAWNGCIGATTTCGDPTFVCVEDTPSHNRYCTRPCAKAVDCLDVDGVCSNSFAEGVMACVQPTGCPPEPAYFCALNQP